MAGYGFVTQGSGGGSNRSGGGSNWRSGSVDDSQMRSAQQAANQWSAARDSFDATSANQLRASNRNASGSGGGNAAFGASGGGNSAFSAASMPGEPPPGYEGPTGGLMYEWNQSGQGGLPTYGGANGFNQTVDASPPTYGGNSGGSSSWQGWFNPDGSPRAGMSQPLMDLAGQSIDWYGSQGNRDAAASTVNTLGTTYNMFSQDREFNANEARWAFDAQQSQWRDLQELGLNRERLGLDSWTAQEAANQWQQDFGLRGRQWDQSYDLQNRQFEADNANTQFANQSQRDYWNAQTGNQRLEIDNTARYQQGVLDNQGREITNTRDYQQGQLSNQRMSIENERWLGEQKILNEQEAMRIDEAYRTGQLTNQQRQIALAELSQKQDDQFRYAQMGQQASQFDVEQASTERYRQLQAQLQREQMENQFRTATMQAIGRNQAQNVRFLRG